MIAWHSIFLTACISETGAHDHHAAVLQKSLVKILKPVHGETLVKKDPLQENNTSPFVMTIVCQPFIYDLCSREFLHIHLAVVDIHFIITSFILA